MLNVEITYQYKLNYQLGYMSIFQRTVYSVSVYTQKKFDMY